MTTTWARWLAGAAATASLLGAPALAQYQEVAPPPPGQGTYQDQPGGDEPNFRGALSPYGEWVHDPGMGEVWRPHRRAVGRNFRPYMSNGHWEYTDYGWYWKSDYPWGWAPFHYGRWLYRPHWGWVWRPSNVWAPAWVEWRSGDGYVGWSPLPPQELATVNLSVSVGEPWYFVSTPNFVSPQLSTVVLPPERVRVVYGTTAPITAHRAFQGATFNVGPPPARVATAIGRPIRPVEVSPHAPVAWRAPVAAPLPGRAVAAPPPGHMVAAPPPGHAVAAPPPGHMMGAPPPGHAVAAPPPGRAVAAPPPGYGMSAPPPGRAVSAPPPGRAVAAPPPGRAVAAPPPGRAVAAPPPGRAVAAPPPAGREVAAPPPAGRVVAPPPPGERRKGHGEH